jgi:hypothetical protein
MCSLTSVRSRKDLSEMMDNLLAVSPKRSSTQSLYTIHEQSTKSCTSTSSIFFQRGRTDQSNTPMARTEARCGTVLDGVLQCMTPYVGARACIGTGKRRARTLPVGSFDATASCCYGRPRPRGRTPFFSLRINHMAEDISVLVFTVHILSLHQKKEYPR